MMNPLVRIDFDQRSDHVASGDVDAVVVVVDVGVDVGDQRMRRLVVEEKIFSIDSPVEERREKSDPSCRIDCRA
jgi:ABC-type amino acid transport substrate-binding protein